MAHNRFPALLAMAASLAAASCDGGDRILPPGERDPEIIEARGGDAQTAEVGSPVTVPPSVVVLDAAERPVAGVEVVFTVVEGGGEVTDPVQVTGPEGVAQVGGWRLGTKPGTNALRVDVEGLEPAVIQATARTGAPHALELVVAPEGPATVGDPVTPSPVVRVVDDFGNPVPAVPVRFRVLEGGGVVEPEEVVTDAEGRAAPDRWTLGPDAGPQVLQARVEGVEAIRITVDGREGGAAHLRAIQGDDQQGTPGETLALAPAVRVEDVAGNALAGVEVTFDVVAGGGSVEPGEVRTDAQGVAEAEAWTLGEQPGEHVVEARVEGLEPVRFNANAVEGAAMDLVRLRGDDQTGPAGEPLPVRPAVRLVDGSGEPVAGHTIAFSVEEGGGAVDPDAAVTDQAGVAEVAWTLGPDPGLQTLAAAADGFDRVVFTATAQPGPPAAVEPVAGEGQSAPAGSAVPVEPAVAVRDRFGNPVPDAVVTFEVVEGGGTIEEGTVTTGADGLAAAGVWTLGSVPGANRLRASVAGAGEAVFRATGVAADQWDLDLRLLSDVTPAQEQALEAARQRWEGVIQGDVPDVPMSIAAGSCLEDQPALEETVDDLLIFVRLEPIDGPGKVLGSAGPCFVRSGSRLPVVGLINLDAADLDVMEDEGILGAVILHEMGHAVGIGTLWSVLDLLVDEGGPDPFFAGEAARAAFEGIGGAAWDGAAVPVENTGGAGTRDGHWREEALANELMTGFINRPPNPLSVLTVASLADLGYAVDLGAADPFAFPAPMAPETRLDVLRELREVPLPPAQAVDPWGRSIPR